MEHILIMSTFVCKIVNINVKISNFYNVRKISSSFFFVTLDVLIEDKDVQQSLRGQKRETKSTEKQR